MKEVNYTNQIRFLLTKTNVLIDLRYDNSKGITHAVKTHQLKMYKPITNIDGSEALEEMPSYYSESDEMNQKAIELIYMDRRGKLSEGMTM